ncbi:MAG: conjugal transfer protein TraN [Candidatus Bathyarchaeia archaeon]
MSFWGILRTLFFFLVSVLKVFIFEGYSEIRHICYQPQGVEVSFDPGVGFCVTNPIDEKDNCPEKYVYNPFFKRCIMVPMCISDKEDELVYWDQLRKQCVTFKPSPSNVTEVAVGLQCILDKNNNNEIEQDEIVQCVDAVDGAKLCPFDMAECQQVYKEVQCPEGFTYNPQTLMCERPPICSISNFTYSNSLDVCIGNIPNCPPGFSYEASRDRCETQPRCEISGFSYDVNRDLCVGSQPTCPTGYSFNSLRLRCERTPSCPNNFSYSNQFDVCIITPNCPQGLTYNATTRLCEAPPQCPSGFTYNPSRGVCETRPLETCPSGYQRYPGTDKCYRGFQCGTNSGYTPDPATGRCYATWHGTNTYVIGLYNIVLNRQPDVNGYNYWLATMSSPPTYYNVINFIREAQYWWELGAERQPPCRIDLRYQGCNREFAAEIIAAYVWFLGRCPDSAGFNYWCNQGYWARGGSTTFQRLATFQYASVYGSGECAACPYYPWTSGSPCASPPSCNLYSRPFCCPKVPSIQGCPCPNGMLNTSTYQCQVRTAYDGRRCYFNGLCRSGETLEKLGSSYYCTVFVQRQCPSGSTYNSATGMCVTQPICPSGSSFSGGKCIGSPSCSGTGGIWNSNIGYCVTNPNCPQGALDTVNDVCYSQGQCPSGSWLNSVLARCVANPNCQGGSLDTARDVCYSSASCPSGSILNGTIDRCVAQPDCGVGSLNTVRDVCQAQGTCPPGTVSTPNGCASEEYSCPYSGRSCHQMPDGKYYCSALPCINVEEEEEEDEPDIEPVGFIQDGARDNIGRCLDTLLIFDGKAMRCRRAGTQTGFHNCCNEANGRIYDNFGQLGSVNIATVVGAIYGTVEFMKITYAAYGVKEGFLQLMADGMGGWKVMSVSSGKTIATFAEDTLGWKIMNNVQTASTTAEAVEMAMTTYFNPQLNPGLALAAINLAVSTIIDDPVIASGVNAGITIAAAYMGYVHPAFAALAVAKLAVELFSKKCDEQDIVTSTLKESGYCHYIGEKCIRRIRLGIKKCTQKAEIYCCFNSKLARIVHEQGRPQLRTFTEVGLWGNQNNPYCRGFTMDEFQALDFGKIDLSEYVEDIVRNINVNIEAFRNRE